MQVLFDRMPILGFAEVGEEMSQPGITEIERLDTLAAQVAQGVLHAFDVCGYCHFPVVPFRKDIRQPDHRRPAPTEPSLLPMPREMPVEHLPKAHLDQLPDE